jgi:hypothetical protein
VSFFFRKADAPLLQTPVGVYNGKAYSKPCKSPGWLVAVIYGYVEPHLKRSITS